MKYLKKAARTAEAEQTDVRAVVERMLHEIAQEGEVAARRHARDLDKWDGDIVVTDAQEEGCDFSWGTSQATASDMLGSSPYARTYVTAFSDLVDHTHVLIEVGGALPLQGVSADFPDMLEHAVRELHECTLRFDHTTQAELAMNGRRVMYTPSLDQCAFNQDEGYYPAGDGVINLCPFTCNTLVQDRRAEDVHAVIALCPD